MSRSRLAIGVSFFVAMLAACASVADLDVKYQPEVTGADGGGAEDGGAEDGGLDALPPRRGNVRDSTVVMADVHQPKEERNTILGTCDVGDLDDGGFDAGCDTQAGLGCCIGKVDDALTTEATCLEQGRFDRCKTRSATKPAVFLGCLRSTNDTPCCWRTVSNVRVALPSVDCDGGVAACLVDEDCPNRDCHTVSCKGNVTFGECGGSPKCPD